MEVESALSLARNLQKDINNIVGPPEEGVRIASGIIPPSMVKGTRGYLEKLTTQINGTYKYGWYDAFLMLSRRLIETLLIETFEAKDLAEKIKDDSGNYLKLNDLISAALQEKSLSLSQKTKKTLPKLRDLANSSAHTRRFNARRSDADQIVSGLRIAVEDLLYLSELKK